MNQDLLELVQCVYCSSNEMELLPIEEDTLEVRKGSVQCKGCKAMFSIHDGIPSFFNKDDRRLIEEQSFKIRSYQEKFQDLYSDEVAHEMIRMEVLGLNLSNFYDLSTRAVMDEAVNQLNVRPGMVVLELGGSTGRDLSRLFVANGCYGIELDINPFLKYSDIIIRENGLFYNRLHASMTKLPLKQGTVDIVFASACVHHVEDPIVVFKEVYRVLKPGGRFVLVNERTLSRLHGKRKELIKNEDIHAHESAFFYSEWMNMLKVAGFKVRALRPTFWSYQIRYERRYKKFMPKSVSGFLLLIYLKSFSIIEKLPLVGKVICKSLFILDREIIGDVGFSCIATPK